MKAAEWQKSPSNGHISDVGPEVSPYASPACTIYFKDGQPSTIPRDIVCVSNELVKICSEHNKIRLDKVPHQAGHVLVHYLHTGSWQTLYKRHPLSDYKTSTQFETSIHVYAAARAYGLPELADLAKDKIFGFAEALPALEAIVLGANACDLLPDDDLWFLAFIKRRIERLFENPGPSDQPVFLKCFHRASTYSKMLIKSMFWICMEKSALSKPAKGHNVPVFDAAASTTSSQLTPDSASEWKIASPMDPPPASESDSRPTREAIIASEPAATGCQIEAVVETRPEAPVLWEFGVEAHAETPAEPQPVPESEPFLEPEPAASTDWLLTEWSSHKTSKKNRKERIQLEYEPEIEAAGEARPEEPVVWKFEVETSAEHQPAAEPVAGTTVEAPEEPKVIGSTHWSWSTVEAAAEEAAPEDIPVSSKKDKKKKKKGKKPKLCCSSRTTHVVDGGWEDCSDCREFVGGLSTYYRAVTDQ
ncbi:uncharacterized protein CTRU02_215758 [Colletotrichum truncatum]|uniref:Uncharacterized protein n=1 Tax=Colletotrichum truncatum TaxID=5467 RepID=A0ACC3YBW3_COLTU|nr:uncharacterized protein CTRU02_15181 [Colletotrichum truncatum]KAF6781331.1 hypothetical protein CTRU02_15181 [Colletotrichum truncatum]